MSMDMDASPVYTKHVDLIGKAEFVRLFQEAEELGKWFSAGELQAFSFPANAGSLAARFLIKKRIYETLGIDKYQNETEILNDESGKPVIKFGPRLKQTMGRKQMLTIMCSISHSRNFATGMTIFCFEPDV